MTTVPVPPIPTAQAVDGAKLLAELRAALTRYVVLPSPQAADAVTLWTAATHAQPAWEHAPRLAVVSPLKRCGKSRLLDVVAETCHAPLITINATIAAVVRSIGSDPPTLLVDEADTLWGSKKQADNNEDLRGRTEWKTADIKAREGQLMQLVEELWKLDLPKLREQAREAAAQQPNRNAGAGAPEDRYRDIRKRRSKRDDGSW